MKKELGDNKLFFAEIFIVIGAFLFSVSLIKIIPKLDGVGWLLIGFTLIIIGAAWKSSKKIS